MFVVGLCGCSGSGKTTLAEKIRLQAPDAVVVISADDYYREIDGISASTRNFDVPDSLDVERLVHDVNELKKGRAIAKIKWDFLHSRRVLTKETIKPKPLVVLEGIFVLHLKKIRDLLDLKIFVELEPELCVVRRLRRDNAALNRNGDLFDQLNRLERDVIPANRQFVEPSKQYADHIVRGDNPRAFERFARALVAKSLKTDPSRDPPKTISHRSSRASLKSRDQRF